MKLCLVIIGTLSVSLCTSLQGQNLVPNPSFEVHDTCPTWSAFLRYAVPWFDPVPTYGGSDYLNSCAPIQASVPLNFFGFQNARTGNAYAGLFVYYAITDAREYIEVQLTDSLVRSKHYCGGFYVNNPECLLPITYGEDRIGMYFSNDSVIEPPNFWYVIPVIPQIENAAGNIIFDTLNWVLISGVFQANGGEKFITIGNFRHDNETQIDSFLFSRPAFCDSAFWLGSQRSAYYFIDDVFVKEMQVDTANTGGDKTICEGDSVQLGIAAGTGCIYAWQPATGLNDSTAAQPIASPAQNTTYVLMLRDTSTGTICDWTSTDTVTITVIPFTPQVADAGTDKTLCKGESIMLGTAPCGNCTYQWQPFSDLNNSTLAQPTATPQQTVAYVLTMTDSVPPCVRTTTDTVNIFVNDCPQPENPVEIYNIFTPNGDAKNDFFFIKNLPANSALQIFNRWGGRVYESGNYNNKWDGGGVPDGTYYYILRLQNKESYHGFVEIRR